MKDFTLKEKIFWGLCIVALIFSIAVHIAIPEYESPELTEYEKVKAGQAGRLDGYYNK